MVVRWEGAFNLQQRDYFGLGWALEVSLGNARCLDTARCFAPKARKFPMYIALP